MNLGVKIGKLQLKYPIVTASGTFGFGEELSSLVDFSSLGALVTKTITLKSRRGNPPPRIREVECGVLNSIGLDNPGVEGFLKNKLPKIKKLGVPFIVSVGGYSPSEYVEVVKVLDRVKGIKAIEINLSCPNLRQKKMFSQSARLTFKITDSLRRITKKTLIVKLTGEVEDIRKIAKSAEYGGADALSLVNTFFAMGVDVDTKKPFLGRVYGGYSGKGIKPLSLYRVWDWEKLIVALDIASEKKIKEVVQALYPKVKKFKVGLIAYTFLGPKIIKWINNQGGEVFLDLKFFDIPNTMSEAAKLAMDMGVWAFTVHLRSGKDSLRFLKEQLVSEAENRGQHPPLIIGVTELTSKKVSLSKVMTLAKVAYESKLDGVVCSVWEARKIKKSFGLLTITPGIRKRKEDDQTRIATVKDALKEDVDYFVVGRPIIKEKDYLKAVKKLLEERRER